MGIIRFLRRAAPAALLLFSGAAFAFPPMLGYTELRTDLPGGRHGNVRTMRASVVNADGTDRREVGGELADGPDVWTQFAGWSPDGRRAVVCRGWQDPENARWEEEHKTFRMEPGKWSLDCCLVDLETGAVFNATAVDRVSHYNGGLFFLSDGRMGFTALVDGVSKPFVMDADGRNINTIMDSEFKLVPNVLKKLFGGDWIRVPNDSFSKTVRWRDGSREVTREVSGKGARFYIRGVRDRNAPSRVDFEIEDTDPEDVTVNVTKGIIAAEERRRWDNAEHRYRILPKSNTKHWKYDREGKKAGTKKWRRVTANEMIDVSRRVTDEWIKDGFPFYAKLWHPHIVSYIEDTTNDRLNQRPYPIAVIERMMKLISKDPRNRRTLEQLNSQWIEKNRKDHKKEVEYIGQRNHRYKYKRRVTFVVESASLELKLPCAIIYEIPEWEAERKEALVGDGKKRSFQDTRLSCEPSRGTYTRDGGKRGIKRYRRGN